MKSYLPIIASLFIASTSFSLPIIASEKQMIAQTINPHIKENIARQITVQVSNGKTKTSGVIVGKHKNSYMVLTNRYIFDSRDFRLRFENMTITTNNGVIYEGLPFQDSLSIRSITGRWDNDNDFVLIGFNSDRDYQVAEINPAAKTFVGQDILLTGFNPETGELITQEGKIGRIEKRSFGGGYSLGLSNDSGRGTIGGAILNTDGELIGINGRNAFSVNNTGYTYDDYTYDDRPIELPSRSSSDSDPINENIVLSPPNSNAANDDSVFATLPSSAEESSVQNINEKEAVDSPSDEKKEPPSSELIEIRQLSWGININLVLSKQREILLQNFNLPFAKNTGEIKTAYDGWIGALESKAKEFTVKIDSPKNENGSGENGSGVIVAKEGNTYTVLTADHVLCQKSKKTEKCIDYAYYIVDFLGRRYSIDKTTITRQPGVDLAVVKFTSDFDYPVAELADYPLSNDDIVFVAGYPKLEQDRSPWLFSLGYGLDEFSGLLNVNDNSLSLDSAGLTATQSSLEEGYEMVYSSITYGGMSGGAVLDKDGRVIGIHGLAEGQSTLVQQSGTNKQIQMGFSLGIPIRTFLGLRDRLKVTSQLAIRDNRVQKLSSSDKKVLDEAISEIKISEGTVSPEKLLERGNQLWRLKLYQRAFWAFDRVAQLDTKFIHLAYYGKALVSLYSGDYETSLEASSLAIESQPNYALALKIKSTSLQLLGRYDEALTAIESAIAVQPNNANFYSEKADTLLDLKRYEDAEIAYSKAIELSPHAAFYTSRGNIFLQQGKLDLAWNDINKALSINPNSSQAYIERANVHYERGNFDLALADLDTAIAKNPTKHFAYFNKGVILYEQNKLDLALNEYDKAIEVTPDYVPAYNNRSLIFKKQGKLDLALADLNKAIEINPNDARNYTNRGNIYHDRGQLDLALDDHNKAIEINPNYDLAYFNRGSVYYEQGDLESALKDFGKAIEFDPKYSSAYLKRGAIYHEQKKLDLALADYNKVIEIVPNDEVAHNNQGIIYHEQKKFDLALHDYERSTTFDENEYELYALQHIGLLEYERGNLDRAQQKFSQAVEGDREFAEARLAFATTLFISGDKEKAIGIAIEALDLDSKYANPEYLKENLWGERLITDTEKLLAYPQIQESLADISQ